MSETETIDTPVGQCRLHRTGRRTLAISVLPDGVIELVAPRNARREDIAAKVGKRGRWILTQRRRFAEMNRDRAPLRYESGATHRYLGRQYRLKVTKGHTPGVRLFGAYFHVTARTGKPAEVETLLDVWMRARAIDQFTARVAKWASWCHDRGLPASQVRLRQMPKRWGSSHGDGRIYLNPSLVRAPSICIDYVIAHEICHLRHPQHDRAFFGLLDQTFPGWRKVKSRLESGDF